MEWLDELQANAGAIMTATSVAISAGVAIFTVRASILTRKKTHVELQESESRIVRPTPQEVDKYGRPPPFTSRAIRKKPLSYMVPGDSVGSANRQWLQEELNNFGAERELRAARMGNYRRQRGNQLEIAAFARWVTLSAFFGASGLSYVYLKAKIHQSYAEGQRLQLQLHDMLAENNGLEQRANLIIYVLRANAKTDEDKAKLEKRLTVYKRRASDSSASHSPNK